MSGGPELIAGEDPNFVALCSETSHTARDILALLTGSVHKDEVECRPRTGGVVVSAMESTTEAGIESETMKRVGRAEVQEIIVIKDDYCVVDDAPARGHASSQEFDGVGSETDEEEMRACPCAAMIDT